MPERKARRTKDEILNVTFDYLVEHGLENTSVRDLCKKLNISSSSLYYWFDGKEDLYISAAKMGIARVVEPLFAFVLGSMPDMNKLFSGFLGELDKYKHELRLIFQLTTSPVYGEHMREQTVAFNQIYSDYINKISDTNGFSPEHVAPIIYLLISIVSDYVVWEDAASTQMQLKYLCGLLMSDIKVHNKE